MKQLFYRVVNGARKVAAGLRPFNESVWPGVRNDLYVAHESVYGFFSRHVLGKRVLDAGCGTGYGASMMLEAGAESVVGVDIDPKTVSFARRSFAKPGLEFRVSDMEALPPSQDSFDLIVASNSLEHLTSPESFIAGIEQVFAPGGSAILAVPPIYGQQDLAVHSAIAYHRSNLSITEWIELIGKSSASVSCFSHRAIGGVHPDFSSHLPSKLDVTDFEFVPVTNDALCLEPSITAIFLVELSERSPK